MKFTLPIHLKSISNRREHWGTAARRAANHRGVAKANVLVRPKVALPVTVTMTMIAPRPLDSDDNLRDAFKALKDGIADAYGLPDNDWRFTWIYAQRRGKAREYAVEIRVDARASEVEHTGV